ncbi:MAG: DUF2240 family protein [Candidatus Poseidoniales archaeon]|nr:MAG: DUF2240 family protein [Candidatus Poseidoniales archaeon]
MSVEDQIEIRRLLAVTFQEIDPESSPSDTVMRIWSLDLHWTDSKGAGELLEVLIQNGWLSIEGSIVSCNANLRDVEIPLGWSPMMRRMLSGIPMEVIPEEVGLSSEVRTSSLVVQEESKKPLVLESPSPLGNKPVDSMVVHIRPIRAFIAAESGLEIAEIQRRAQRKRTACPPMTMWMALLLLGREQRIDLSSFLE